MSQLIIYNCTPWKTFVQVNGISDTPWSPLEVSTSKDSYFPYSNSLRRDLTQDWGAANIWGKMNKLVISWAEISNSMSFTKIQDPPKAAIDTDMLLWIFPNRVLFSQLSNALQENHPNQS